MACTNGLSRQINDFGRATALGVLEGRFAEALLELDGGVHATTNACQVFDATADRSASSAG